MLSDSQVMIRPRLSKWQCESPTGPLGYGIGVMCVLCNFLLQSLMHCSDWGSLTPAAILRSASSPTSCCSSEQPAWVRFWWTRWRPLWRKLSTPPHGRTYRCPHSSAFTYHYMSYYLWSPYYLLLFLTLAVLADFAQLPVNGGHGDVDQPGHEKH